MCVLNYRDGEGDSGVRCSAYYGGVEPWALATGQLSMNKAHTHVLSEHPSATVNIHHFCRTEFVGGVRVKIYIFGTFYSLTPKTRARCLSPKTRALRCKGESTEYPTCFRNERDEVDGMIHHRSTPCKGRQRYHKQDDRQDR